MKNQIEKLTATEAARDFSRLLDRIESGGEVVIERHAKPVAVVGPAFSAPRRISDCIAMPIGRPSAMADPGFAADLEDIIAGHPVPETPEWE